MKTMQCCAAFLLIASLLWACKGPVDLGLDDDLISMTDPNMDAKQYGLACKKAVASIPPFSCRDGVVVAVTVDGKTPAAYTKDMNCDRPSLLSSFPGEVTDGRCVPWSRALILQDDAVAQVQATCRKKLIRPQESPLFDEIDIIAHSVTEGTTCWFQALSANPTGDPAIGLDGSKVPSPTMDKNPEGFPDPLAFWQTPQQIAKIDCGNCHDNDPFYYSPWIAQTGELPADPFGRYNNNVGPMSLWTQPMSIETPGNTCTGCHRIGNLHTCHTGMYQTFDPKTIEFLSAWGKQYPQSHWMPAGNKWTKAQWDVVYTDAIEALATCCKDPKAAECTLTEVASVVN